ncbi:WD40 repeat-like superfamily protein [Klebsormidium nitens]|uniref:WD40 repeat-like superfamily protein n=1 Tax=Klebsormidium nitens TaxID=105231 RepID=A0A1Y1HI00_KLENI|nr:WD40 repeat-like superfamily protein [Klebsormidium nitens]|eukprot:GAQ78070.1 WD40 repeat-like superfamily protein [Klebsormidium nitens]
MAATGVEGPPPRKKARKSDGSADTPKPSLEEAQAVIEKQQQKDTRKKAVKYNRGPQTKLKGIQDKKLKGQLRATEKLYGEAATSAAKVEQWLLPAEAGFLEAEGVERTQNYRQEAILPHLDLTSQRKIFDLRLPDLGPYSLDYTRSGRHLLVGGRKGHLAIMDWARAQLVTELQVKETTRDVQFLHNESFFAAAQKKYVYVYDKRGIEVHCLKEHTDVLKLGFLHHHFLLASVGKYGVLRYQDTSTGAIVSQHKTKLGRCGVLGVNPYNAAVGLGHSNGTVSFWSPNMSTPLVSLLCHRGPVTALAFDVEGRHMVTGGIDGQVKVWDVRKFQPVHAYFSPQPAQALDVSQRGLLTVAHGSTVQVWQDALKTKAKSPYLTHRLFDNSAIADVAFCPFEDALALGHSGGFSSIIVPGAGNPNFDSFVANPYETKKQRREAEVHLLLDKLQPETITLDPYWIGGVRKAPKELQKAQAAAEAEANRKAALQAGKEAALKNKAKGKSKPTKKHRKKQLNIIDNKKATVSADLASKQLKRKQESAVEDSDADMLRSSALARFYKR